jgi:hypothetical protein
VTTLHGTDITLVGSTVVPDSHPVWNRSGDGVWRSRVLAPETVEVFRPRAIGHSELVDTTRHAPRSLQPACAIASRRRGRISSISNFRPSKRVEDVVRVFAAVRREVPSVLLMVGDGADRTRSRELAVSLGVERYVRYLGQLDAVEDVLSAGDLFLLTSANESFGLVALEAMSSGVPVIGTTAEVPELIDRARADTCSRSATSRECRRSTEILTDERLTRRWRERRAEWPSSEAARSYRCTSFYARVTASRWARRDISRRRRGSRDGDVDVEVKRQSAVEEMLGIVIPLAWVVITLPHEHLESPVYVALSRGISIEHPISVAITLAGRAPSALRRRLRPNGYLKSIGIETSPPTNSRPRADNGASDDCVKGSRRWASGTAEPSRPELEVARTPIASDHAASWTLGSAVPCRGSPR